MIAVAPFTVNERLWTGRAFSFFMRARTSVLVEHLAGRGELVEPPARVTTVRGDNVYAITPFRITLERELVAKSR